MKKQKIRIVLDRPLYKSDKLCVDDIVDFVRVKKKHKRKYDNEYGFA